MYTPKQDPTAVAAWFDYRDGALYWKQRPSRKIMVGARAGSFDTHGYRQVGWCAKDYKEHHLVWAWHHGKWPADELDHMDCDHANNRIENLRESSSTMNKENLRAAQKNNLSTGVLGVYIPPGRTRPRARIKVGYKQINLGTFDTVEEAHQAYLAAKRVLHEGNTL